MTKTASALTLALVLGFCPAKETVAQEGIPSPPPAYYVTETSTGDVHAPHYDVVTSPNGNLMIVGGTPDMIARTELTGLWRAVHLEQNGTADPALAEQLHMRFYPGKVELMQTMRPTIEMAYRPETLHEPHHFSWFTRSCGLIVLQRGVYWITDDDKLLLCLGSINERRASDFVTAPGDGRTLFILERVVPAR